MRWKTVTRVLIAVCLAAAALGFDYEFAVRHGFFDLHVYYGAINYWIYDHGTIYDYLSPHSTYGFTYPPFAVLTMLPMAITPWTAAIVISCVLCLATTAIVLRWFVLPIARRKGWTPWFAMVIALCCATVFEPLRETFLFGQVNMLLVFLVVADFVLLLGRGSRWAGVGIGLATAIKLTPGIFIAYLLITRRWRAAIVASATAAVATVVAAAIAPQASLVFWTEALWNTDRVGELTVVSNQSLNGAVARLNEADPSTLGWLAAAAVALVVWAIRARRVAAAGDDLTGFALTGIVGCLVSPITWVHHLVWLGPALVLLLDNALLSDDPRRRKRLLGFMVVCYGLLCSRLVWPFDSDWSPVRWILASAYTWVSVALLIGLPIRPADARGAAQSAAVGAHSGTRVPRAGGLSSRPLAEIVRGKG
jgi:alpha-1,2-mannosyltransferase